MVLLMSHPAFDFQPQHIYRTLSVLIFRPTAGRSLNKSLNLLDGRK